MAHYKRITKKENIKGPDEFFGFWTRVFLWTQEKKDNLLLPAIGLGVALALVAGFFYYRQQREAAANRELAAIMRTLPRPGAQNAASPEQVLDSLRSYGEKYSATRPGRIGQLYRGNFLYQRKHYDEAEKAYRAAMDGNDVVAHLASMGLAAAYQEEGKFADAAGVLEKFRKDSAFAEDMDYMMARNQELAANKDAALKEYRAFLEKHPSSRYADDVRERLSRLS